MIICRWVNSRVALMFWNTVADRQISIIFFLLIKDQNHGIIILLNQLEAIWLQITKFSDVIRLFEPSAVKTFSHFQQFLFSFCFFFLRFRFLIQFSLLLLLQVYIDSSAFSTTFLLTFCQLSVIGKRLFHSSDRCREKKCPTYIVSYKYVY